MKIRLFGIISGWVAQNPFKAQKLGKMRFELDDNPTKNINNQRKKRFSESTRQDDLSYIHFRIYGN